MYPNLSKMEAKDKDNSKEEEVHEGKEDLMKDIISNEEAHETLSSFRKKYGEKKEISKKFKEMFPSSEAYKDQELVKGIDSFLKKFEENGKEAEKRALFEICPTGSKKDFPNMYKTKKLKFICRVCSKKFLNRRKVNKHILTKHLHEKLKTETENDAEFKEYRNSVFIHENIVPNV